MVDADSFFVGVNKVLNQEGRDNLSTTLKELSQTVRNINAVALNLDELLTKQKGNLNTTLTNVASISNNVNQLTDSLAQSNFKQTLSNFETTVNRLNTVLADLEAGKGSVGKLLKDEALYENIEASTKEIELLIKDLEGASKALCTFSLFGKKEVPYEETETKE